MLIEDEDNLREVMALNLELEGYDVSVATDGSMGTRMCMEQEYDLVILDLMLPFRSGMDICRDIRQGGDTPVLMISARGDSRDRVAGLRQGADDYLAKPFDLEELILRVQLLLRRGGAGGPAEERFRLGEFMVDFAAMSVIKDGAKVADMNKRECEILKVLQKRAGKVVTREEIVKALHVTGQVPTPRSVDNVIVSLRRIFQEDPRSPRHFISVRGLGYRFQP